MLNNKYIHFSIKRNKRYVSVRIPTYLIKDYSIKTINKNLEDYNNYELVSIKKQITENIQNLYNNNLEPDIKESTFIYYINELIYTDLIKNSKPMFKIYNSNLTK